MPVHNHFLRDHNKEPNPSLLTAVGAFFPIEIHVPPPIAQVLTDKGESIPEPASGLALIDTGATMTCVHEAMLTKLGLSPIGLITSGTAGGPVQQSLYPARLVFPTTGWAVDLAAVAGVNLSGQQIASDPPQPIIALVGRNILEHWVFVWNGPGGHWTVAI